MTDDRKRLAPSRAKVAELMGGGEWWRSDRLAQALNLRNLGTATSRIRDLAAYFGWEYERRGTDTPGIYEYRLYRPLDGQLSLL